jgi:hypothetical protein
VLCSRANPSLRRNKIEIIKIKIKQFQRKLTSGDGLGIQLFQAVSRITKILPLKKKIEKIGGKSRCMKEN